MLCITGKPNEIHKALNKTMNVFKTLQVFEVIKQLRLLDIEVTDTSTHITSVQVVITIAVLFKARLYV